MPTWKKRYKQIKGFALLDGLISICVLLPFATAVITGLMYGPLCLVIGFGSEVSILAAGIFLFVLLTKFVRGDNVYCALALLGYLIIMMIGSVIISVFRTGFLIQHHLLDPPPPDHRKSS